MRTDLVIGMQVRSKGRLRHHAALGERRPKGQLWVWVRAASVDGMQTEAIKSPCVTGLRHLRGHRGFDVPQSLDGAKFPFRSWC